MPEVFKDYVKNKFRSSGPLKGVRVLEVCTLLFGPSGPSFLAEMGAEVIKVEKPGEGDARVVVARGGDGRIGWRGGGERVFDGGGIEVEGVVVMVLL